MASFLDKFRSATDPNSEMSFVDHLESLRWHLVRSSAVIITLALVAFFYKDILFDTIIFGPKRTDFWTYRMLCKLQQYYNLDAGLCIDKINFTIMNNTMAGQFNLHLTASFYVGFVLGFPYLLMELWQFIKPGLHKKERKRLKNRGRSFPKWQNKNEISEFYKNCPEGYVVDHIIPLKGAIISGLHVISNLQYLSIEDNLLKSNIWDGTESNSNWKRLLRL